LHIAAATYFIFAFFEPIETQHSGQRAHVITNARQKFAHQNMEDEVDMFWKTV